MKTDREKASVAIYMFVNSGDILTFKSYQGRYQLGHFDVHGALKVIEGKTHQSSIDSLIIHNTIIRIGVV